MIGFCVGLALCSCNGVVEPSGIGEPFFVESATFVPGELPGIAPLPNGVAPDSGSQIVDINTTSSLLPQGQASHGFSGHASTDAYSIGVRLQDAGSGYWLMPVAGPDPSENNDLTWSFTADIGWDAPVGNQSLLFVAFDSNGNAGAQQALPICVSSYLPDNLNSCDPQIKPPAAIVSLTWDSDADMDLVVVTPDGTVVDSKHPVTAPIASGGVPTQFLPSKDKTTGYIDQDSNGDCVLDNQRHEEIVWQEAPAGGTFDLEANLFSACDAASATFKMTTYRQQVGADGKTWSLAITGSASGEMIPLQANGGAGPALYVSSISFP
jgi:hypothetical protein